jgi:membrane protein
MVTNGREVLRRMGEIRGGQLVDSLVLKLFLSLFPLLIIAVAILGFVAARRSGGAPALTDQIVANLKLKGSMADLLKDLVTTAEEKRGAASAVGLIGVVFSGLAVVGAIAAMCNAAWQVSSRGFLDRLIGLGWLLGAVVLVGLVGVATALVKIVHIPFVNTLAGFGAGVASVSALFWWTQLALTNIRIPPRAYVPGALVGAIGVSLFQVFGAVLITRILSSASAGASSIAAVVAFLTFFSIFGRLFLLSVLVNVVAWEAKHGTVQLAINAPAVPAGVWVQTQRGGQRGKRSQKHSTLAQRATDRAKAEAGARIRSATLQRDQPPVPAEQ